MTPHHLQPLIAIISAMHLRDSVLIQHRAIDAADLQFLAAHVAHAQLTQSLVSNHADDDGSEVEWVVDTNVRDTQEVHVDDPLLQRLYALMDAAAASWINPFYNVTVRDRERPQILRYGVGGHYIPHVDAETLYTDDIGLRLWEKTLDRDLSVVYFLNDDFTGGQLVFPELDLVIDPRAGTLVCFPSDHNFIHGVHPVTSGRRYTLVTWLRVKGMPSVEEINEQNMKEYERAWPQQIEQPPRIVNAGAKQN